jgi:predicted ATPase
LQYHARNYLRDFKGVSANMQYALEQAEQLLELALQFEDPAPLMNAYRTCGITCVEVGRHREAKEYFIRAVALHRKANSAPIEVQTIYHEAPHLFSNYAFALWLSGYPEQAQACAAEALSLAETLGNPMQKSLALFYTSVVYRYLNHVERLTAQVKTMLTLDHQYAMPITRLNGLFAHGWVLAQLGELQEGATQMRAVIDEYISMNLNTHQPHLLAWLAEALLLAGQWQAAVASLDEGMAIAGAIGQRSCDAELHRLRGVLFMHADATTLKVIAPDAAADSQAAAQSSFLQAIELARAQEAKSFELRAVMSLCRLWQQQGREAEAYTLLSDLYNWFTEGFDTHDLQEARSLLAGLAA